MIKIQKVEDSELKARIVDEVLLDLPEWFGLEDSRQEYIKEARDLALWCAYKDQESVAFATLSSTSEDCGEIHCMGVKKAYHGQGIGRQLVESLEKEAGQQFSILQVKTVDEGHYKEYDSTIQFYKRVGFKKLEVFPDLWDEWNPCLVMVKML